MLMIVVVPSRNINIKKCDWVDLEKGFLSGFKALEKIQVKCWLRAWTSTLCLDRRTHLIVVFYLIKNRRTFNL